VLAQSIEAYSIRELRNKLRQAYRWKALIFIYIFMLAFAVTFQGIPPVLNFIVSSFGISHAQAGGLMSFFGLAGILISIPGGILADVYGARRVGMAALGIALVGSLVVGFGDRFSLLLVGRFICGIGALTVAVTAPRTLSQWFADGDLGKAMGIFNTAMPLGTIFALNVFGRLAAVTSWRVPIFLTAGYCFFMLLLFFFRYPALPGEEDKQKRDKLDFKKRLAVLSQAGSPIWLVAVVWMMYNAAAIAYLTFAGEYYLSLGYDVSHAGFFASLFCL
jgi:predicted MFS family arabinose efflux permease